MATIKKANPMQTRTGKPRLGPLNVTQLQALFDKSSKKKDRAKIQNRINTLVNRPGYTAPAAPAAE